MRVFGPVLPMKFLPVHAYILTFLEKLVDLTTPTKYPINFLTNFFFIDHKNIAALKIPCPQG